MHEGGAGRVVLWDAARPRLVDRKAVETLWRAGKVTGLFNLRTREQFDACRDFCVEASEGSREAAASEAEELQGLRTRLADAQAENLMLEERIEALQKQQQQQQRSKITPAMVDGLKRECASLKVSSTALKAKLASSERTVAQQKDEIVFVVYDICHLKGWKLMKTSFFCGGVISLKETEEEGGGTKAPSAGDAKGRPEGATACRQGACCTADTAG